MRTKKTFYLFDIGGILIDTFKGRQELADKLKITIGTLESSIKRKSCLQRKYYVMTENKIDIKALAKKGNHNPVLKTRDKHLGFGISNNFNSDLDFLQDFD